MPRTDGRETLGRARCAHSGKEDTASQPAGTHNCSRLRGPGPKRKGGGRGERVLQQHSRASTWPGHSRTRASGKRSLSPCLKQLQHAIATKGVSPLSQLRRCLRRALALLRARQHVVRQWRVLLLGSSPTPPHPTAIPCALYDSENSCCMQCGWGSTGARP